MTRRGDTAHRQTREPGPSPSVGKRTPECSAADTQARSAPARPLCRCRTHPRSRPSGPGPLSSPVRRSLLPCLSHCPGKALPPRFCGLGKGNFRALVPRCKTVRRKSPCFRLQIRPGTAPPVIKMNLRILICRNCPSPKKRVIYRNRNWAKNRAKNLCRQFHPAIAIEQKI